MATKKKIQVQYKPALPPRAPLQFIQKLITPAEAEALLAKNFKNRPLRVRRVQSLIRAIRAGDFMENGDTIRMDAEGNLLDGQHRLNAIKDAGIPTWVTFVCIAPAARKTIDRGGVRDDRDDMAFDDFIDHPDIVAPAARLILMAVNCDSPSLTTSEVRRVIDRHRQDFEWAAKSIYGTPGRTRLFPGQITAAFVFAHATKEHRKAIENMVTQYKQGDSLVRGSGAWVLRETMIKAKGQGTNNGRRIEMFKRGLSAIFNECIGNSRTYVRRNKGAFEFYGVEWADATFEEAKE